MRLSANLALRPEPYRAISCKHSASTVITTPRDITDSSKDSRFFFFAGLGLAAGLFFFVTSGDFFLAGDLDVLAGDLEYFLAALLGFGEGLFPVLARFCQKKHVERIRGQQKGKMQWETLKPGVARRT